jgi:hypothetical protein
MPWLHLSFAPWTTSFGMSMDPTRDPTTAVAGMNE